LQFSTVLTHGFLSVFVQLILLRLSFWLFSEAVTHFRIFCKSSCHVFLLQYGTLCSSQLLVPSRLHPHKLKPPMYVCQGNSYDLFLQGFVKEEEFRCSQNKTVLLFSSLSAPDFILFECLGMLLQVLPLLTKSIVFC
jgi:hypothetical protein